MDDKTSKKILPLKEIAKRIEDLKAKGKKVVQCHGVFDIVHLGHIRHFNLAKKEGDVLLVTLTADKYVKRGPGRPIFNEQLRAEYLASLSTVDFVGILNSETATEGIKLLKPNFYAKGMEYKNHKKNVWAGGSYLRGHGFAGYICLPIGVCRVALALEGIEPGAGRIARITGRLGLQWIVALASEGVVRHRIAPHG